jgi:hypothetical protein
MRNKISQSEKVAMLSDDHCYLAIRPAPASGEVRARFLELRGLARETRKAG